MKRGKHKDPEWLHGGRRISRNAVRVVIHFFAFIGMTVLYYVGFSLLVDTPTEYHMKRSTALLERQYNALDARYDSLEAALGNIEQRDRSVFRTLFEAEPYDFEGQSASTRWAAYERLLTRSNRDLGAEFLDRTNVLTRKLATLENSYLSLELKTAALGARALYIPAIQPVANNELTLLTASYGMRMHPFYKTLASHQGVDYTVPEGSRVFATADGTVRDIVCSSTSGTTLILSHGNGYETMYAHLQNVNVGRGEQIRRGDIVATTGNTGLSLTPHLHYEISHNGMRVDPVHYFFMELSPMQYERIIRIAQSGMQSFD
jgi:murein DD-endopeptidase MepM/ murein hydrolase activator NlpD